MERIWGGEGEGLRDMRGREGNTEGGVRGEQRREGGMYGEEGNTGGVGEGRMGELEEKRDRGRRRGERER